MTEPAKQEFPDLDYHERMQRRVQKIVEWAERQEIPHEEMIVRYAWTVVFAMEERALMRIDRKLVAASNLLIASKEAEIEYQRSHATRYARDLISIKEERRRGGLAKTLNSPKRVAKEGALSLWKERYDGKHPKLRTVEQFATEVMRRWPILTSSKVICGWSAQWTKDVKAGRPPAC